MEMGHELISANTQQLLGVEFTWSIYLIQHEMSALITTIEHSVSDSNIYFRISFGRLSSVAFTRFNDKEEINVYFILLMNF